MLRCVIFAAILLTAPALAFAEQYYRYEYSDESESFERVDHREYSKDQEAAVVAQLKSWVEGEFNVKLDITYQQMTDGNDHHKRLYTINIRTPEPFISYPEYGLHKSLLTATVVRNFMQVEPTHWFIYAMVLKVNWIFADELGTDTTYDAIMTGSSVKFGVWARNYLMDY
jgi:hypothetical protein